MRTSPIDIYLLKKKRVPNNAMKEKRVENLLLIFRMSFIYNGILFVLSYKFG